MKIDLEGQTALVTGASRGLGKAIAAELGRAGATTLGTATGEEGVAAIEAELRAGNLRGRGLRLDVTQADSVAALEQNLREADDFPSILVNNAGITRDNLLLRMREEEWREVIDANLTSLYRLCKLCLRAMTKRRYGRIVNVSSVVALSGNPGQANYGASKAGMIGFTRSLAREIGGRGITVNCVAPGFIVTDMTERLDEEQKQALTARIPVGRLGNVEEVAQAVTFLASPAAGYICGETLHINGGMYMA